MYARKEAEFAEQMKMKWEKVISGKSSDADIKDIINWLTDNQKEDGVYSAVKTQVAQSNVTAFTQRCYSLHGKELQWNRIGGYTPKPQ